MLPDPTKLYRGYSAANALSSAIWQLVVLPVTFLLLTNGDVPTSHTQWYAFACSTAVLTFTRLLRFQLFPTNLLQLHLR